MITWAPTAPAGEAEHGKDLDSLTGQSARDGLVGGDAERHQGAHERRLHDANVGGGDSDETAHVHGDQRRERGGVGRGNVDGPEREVKRGPFGGPAHEGERRGGEQPAGRSGTVSRRMMSEMRAASPLTPAAMLFTAVPIRFASSATHQRFAATGWSSRCHAQPLARGESRLMSSAVASSPTLTAASTWNVCCQGNRRTRTDTATNP